ncbi:GTP:AMP phosphotransferase AK3, mitochondrial isoform X2 [Parasteatoda tepidariorum]|uniref:GTP:AMP phosphotransferase AK3, mitochondrial isoform X2 n=1 Tax=Parasteatoda tepidariorum TaxID=114398 RepID=UPI00077FB1D9|nr:GTP:AMP phosphotransferase AK3, mitochondrial isoform X2 [Parasteatoda tepidariorum]
MRDCHNYEEGLEAKNYIEKGKLVPDELVSNLVLEKVKLLSDKNWLLDGFPRTAAQADMLSAICDIKRAISLDVPDEIIVSRLKGRWLHLPSGRIYNLEFNPPKVPGKDDITGESLVQRDDDKPDVVLARLSNYRKENSPVLEYYRKKMLLQEFTGKESNEIWPRIKLYLEKIMKDAT